MRMLTIAAAAAFLVAGCATTSVEDRQTLVGKSPTAEFVSDKPANDVFDCVLTNVRAVADAGHSVSSRMEGHTHIVWVTTLANPIIAVRIAPATGGTAVDYRSRYRTGYGKFTNAVTSCR